MTEWVEKNLEEIVEINPSESIKKGQVAKKVPMDKLQPNCRDIPGFEFEPYSGGAKFRNKDTIMARITPCLENGKIAQVNILDEGEIGFGSTEFLVFRARKGNDANFIYYLVSSPIVREPAIKSMVGSSGRQRVQTGVVKKLRIKVPSLCEQEAIAGILKSLDDKISANNMINHNLQQQAQLLYEHLLDGDITRHRLGDILTLLKDGTHNPPKRLEKGIPLITGQTLSNGFISYEKMTYIAESDYQTIHKTYQPIENDLILTKIGTVGKVAILRNSDLPIAVHCNSALLRFNSNIISQQWGFFLLNSSAFGIELRKKVTNTVQDFVSLGHLADIIITLPPAEVIKRYDGYFKTILETLSNNDFENRRLAMLRDALLPKLMSGEIDVSEVEL